MTPTGEPNTPESREQATSRLRALTRAAILAAGGATVLVGVVVAHDHPGAGSSRTDGSSGTSNTGSSTSGSSSSSGDGGSVANGSSTTSTGSTGNTGSSSAPTASSSRPSVTSGGTSS